MPKADQTSAYYRTESKSIQRFVLHGRRLRDHLGGSAIVKRAFQDTDGGLLYEVAHEIAGEPPGESGPIFSAAAAAGGATIRFRDREHLARFAALWPRRLEEAAPGLRMVQAWCDADDPTFVRTLSLKLDEARERPPVMLPLGNPVIDRPNQGSAPASKWDDTTQELVDSTLWAQRQEAHQNTEVLNSETGRVSLHAEVLGRPDAVFPVDIDEIAGHGDRHYIAVVQIDGNDVGRRVQQIHDLQTYRSFAEALHEATLAATRAAIATLPVPRLGSTEPTDVYMGRPIVLGGDDVTFVVRADAALRFVQAYAEAFERETSARPAVLGTLSASAGVAFVRAKHPFRQAHHLAEALIGEAKRRGRFVCDPSEPPTSMIAFQRVTTSLEPDARAPFVQSACATNAEGNPRVDDGRGYLALTHGPYQLTGKARAGIPHVDELRPLVRLLTDREIPRGPFRELARTLSEAPDEAKVALGRIQQVQSREAWAELEQAARALTDDSVLWGERVEYRNHPKANWLRGRPEVSTPWLDILALVAVGAEDEA